MMKTLSDRPLTDASTSPAGFPPRTRRLLLLAAMLAVAALISLFADLSISQQFFAWEHGGAGDFRRIVNLFEAFAHGAGVLVILLAIAVLDPGHRLMIPRLIACSLGAGAMNTCFKLLIGRSRPSNFWDGTLPWPDSVSQTFLGFAPTLGGSFSDLFERQLQSFPSGHAVVAAGLAVGLSWLYPRGRWLFAGLAVMSTLQRVVTGAHFPSDVLMGAAEGVAFATICLDKRLLGRWFQRFENRQAK